jgi:uncharacterized membrane protein
MSYASVTPNKELMAQARDSLRGAWGLAVSAVLVYFVTLFVGSLLPLVGWIVSSIIGGPMQLGLVIFSLCLARRQDPKVAQVFDGFNRFGASLGAYVLTAIFTFLWSLLLIIPGIIAAYSYAMTYYIIAEDSSIGPLAAIKKSKEMMQGNKWKLFCLGCRFIGWGLLCMLTLGIGFLWLAPYMAVSVAKFYDDLAGNRQP